MQHSIDDLVDINLRVDKPFNRLYALMINNFRQCLALISIL
jgi:hypothetical protein